MTRWAPRKADVLDALATEILQQYSRGRVIVAIDGTDGAGKTHFAAALAEAIGRRGHAVFTASIDDFHQPYELATAAGEDDGPGWYRHAYDYSLLRRVLLDPFKLSVGTGFVTAGFDRDRNIPFEPKWRTGPKDAILIVEGVFLNRPELRGLWNYSIWLEVPAAVALERYSVRDGSTSDTTTGLGKRYEGAQRAYVKESKPKTIATAIIDNSDFDHPRRVFADSC
jgi:uridine kinase